MIRVVLVVPRVVGFGLDKAATWRAAAAMDRVAELGYALVGVIDPAQVREAHRMIADDLADIIVVFRLEAIPSVQALGEVGASTVGRRTQRLLRPAAEVLSAMADAGVPAPAERPVLQPARPADHWRPEPVDGRRADRQRRPEPVAGSDAVGLPAQRRTEIIKRGDADRGQAHAMHRRPQPVEPTVLPEPVDAEPQIAQTPAHPPDPVSEPRMSIPASRRASQSHRSGTVRRRRT